MPKDDEEQASLLPNSPSQIETGLNGLNGRRRGLTPDDERKSSEPMSLDTPPGQRQPGGIRVLPVGIRGDSRSIELDDITRTPEAEDLKVSNV